MIFGTRYDPSPHFSYEGRVFPKCANKYGVEFDKDTGREKVVIVGQTDVYAARQEALQDTLIYNIIDKVSRTGDFSLLGENMSGFIDTLDAPRDFMSACCVRSKVEQTFAALPYEERAKYNNDIYTFTKAVSDKLKERSLSKGRAEILNQANQEVDSV